MKLDLSADSILFRKKKRIKSQHAKLQLSVLATEARTGIDENNQLTSSIVILKRLVKKNKQILNSLISCKKISKKEVQQNLTDEKQELLLLNKNLKGERNLLKLKYSKSKNEIEQTLTNLKTEFNILENRKFIYQNALIEKESIIKKIKNNLKLFCKAPYPIMKEEEREVFVNLMDSESILGESLEMIQIELMFQSKSFNKYQNRYISLMDYKNELLDERRKLKNKSNSDKINDIEYINEYIDKLEAEDSILNESISSVIEDDYNNIEFPDVTSDKCTINKNNLENKFKLPKLSMSQIIYNKKKFKPEDEEKSLSRIMLNKLTSKDLKIKKMKENIKKMKKRIKIKEKKCKEFEGKIKRINLLIEKYMLANETNTSILKTEISSKERPCINYSE